MSHPAWVCGLKQKLPANLSIADFVTPCVGVWIETKINELNNEMVKVTPCVGVWIETKIRIGAELDIRVTPCVGVWIETR